MCRAIVPSVLCIVSLMLLGGPAAAATEKSVAASDDGAFHFTVDSRWENQSKAHEPVVIVRKQTRSELHPSIFVISIKSEDKKKNPPLEWVGQMVVLAAQRFAPDAKILAEHNGTLHGEKARKVVITGRDAKSRVQAKMLGWVFYHKESLYLLLLVGPADDYEQLRGEFDNMLNSLEFDH